MQMYFNPQTSRCKIPIRQHLDLLETMGGTKALTAQPLLLTQPALGHLGDQCPTLVWKGHTQMSQITF